MTKQSITICRILKVNHAGEYGAIRIYMAQIMIAKMFFRDLLPFLEETIEHEKEHCRMFREAMPPRNARPCRTMFLWSWGGFLLGLSSTLLGRNGIMICTEAVEDTVHKHLEEQILFLREHDPEACALIEDIKEQELEHLSHARANINKRGALGNMFQKISVAMVEVVIWLSTWGDSASLKTEMMKERNTERQTA